MHLLCFYLLSVMRPRHCACNAYNKLQRNTNILFLNKSNQLKPVKFPKLFNLILFDLV